MFKFKKTMKVLGVVGGLFFTASTVGLAVSCSTPMQTTNQATTTNTKKLRVATFNISFAVDNHNMNNGGPDYWQRWNNYMSFTREQQDSLIKKWIQNEPNSLKPKDSKANVDTDEHLIAERIIQIRNIAAQIQYVRPDIIVLDELNNNGVGTSGILKLFQDNYLSHPQYYQSHDGSVKTCTPIHYPFTTEYATNTGELAVDANNQPLDLDNDGSVGKQATQDITGGVVLVEEKTQNGDKVLVPKEVTIRKGQVYKELGTRDGKPLFEFEPDDTFGFGYYHGHYAFGVMSKYKLDTSKDREFRKFKLKDMPNSQQYRAKVDTRLGNKYAPGTFVDANTNEVIKYKGYWHNDTEWENFRMSSKNHVDLPVIVGNETIHLLLSHPTPTGFDKVAPNNVLRNRAEIDFWRHYINNEPTLYDDNGVTGGLPAGSKFIILGDLNADHYLGKDDGTMGAQNPQDYNSGIGITNLVKDPAVNPDVIEWDAKHVPWSFGALEDKNPPNNWNEVHEYAFVKSSVFGTRADWAIPSKNLEVIGSRTFWHGKKEDAYGLFINPKLGNNGNSKEVSSDHRLVYVDLKVSI